MTCNYSARGRDPDISAGEFGEDIEGPTAVFGRRGEVGAHRGEVLGAGEGAHTPGDLLLDLDHADVAFGRVVVEGHPEVDGEAQIVLQAPADAAGQGPMAGGGPPPPPRPGGGARPPPAARPRSRRRPAPRRRSIAGGRPACRDRAGFRCRRPPSVPAGRRRSGSPSTT